MEKRPPAIEIRSQSHGPLNSNTDSFSRPLPSPRLHIAGEVPPELSPLDAFAAQSRLLARKLEEGAKEGKRLSRLPPLSAENSLAAQRPSYLRSASAQEPVIQTEPPRSPGFGVRMEMENSVYRPMSVHPHVSKISATGPRVNISHNEDGQDIERGRKPHDPSGQLTPHVEESIKSADGTQTSETSTPDLSRFPRLSIWEPQRDRDCHPPLAAGLVPPRSPFALRVSTSQTRSSIEDSYDGGSIDADSSLRPNLRKFSSSSGLSNSPISPIVYSQPPRSPSACSDMSSAYRLSRPAFNFSRPLSRAEPPVRQSSGDNEPLFMDDSGQTPISLHQGGSFDSNLDAPLSSSYVYSKYTLPRGRALQRSPITPIDPTLKFFDGNVGIESSPHAPPSPPYISSPTQMTPVETVVASGQESTTPLARATPNETNAASTTHPQGSAEWHVRKGIDCHETGSVNESTYHLRIAAKKNHPTGMLLYALACRHGWGMKPNQEEGVRWLKKAADTAQLQVADDEDKDGIMVDSVTKKARKAQFALSVYELGMSHLNGWGIEQDKALALRCFEIAGAWGDADALQEAGFCYASGIGCKKDLKKSAQFYRQAGSKGVSMVGNSWIYKSKYDDEPNEPKKKSRDKSQTRSIFGRKKPTT